MEFSEEEFNQIVQVFEVESQESIAKINQLLLRLEKDNDDLYAVQELFREAHSLKGAARMLGFIDIQNLAHAFENVMGQKKNNKLDLNAEIFDLLGKAIACMEKVVDKIIQSKGEYKSQEVLNLIEALNAVQSSSQAQLNTNVIEVMDEDIQEDIEPSDIEVGLKELDQLCADFSVDAENKLIGMLGVLKGVKANDINQMADSLYEKLIVLIERIIKNRFEPDEDFLQDIKKAIELSKAIIMDDSESYDDANLLEKRLLILAEMVDMFAPQESVKDSRVDLKKIDSGVQPSLGSSSEKIEAIEDINLTMPESTAIKTLRVDSNKLDKLVNQVGELIIARIKNKEHIAELEKISDRLEDLYKTWNKNRQYLRFHDKKRDFESYEKIFKNIQTVSDDAAYSTSELIGKVSDLYRIIQEDDTRLSLIVGDLEHLIKGVRLLPFATIFHMFPRMVRDIARERNKQAELVISGSETSADKKIIEEIKSPLVHLIRNAVDHGIETAEERISQGKDPIGTINLCARHMENSIIIEIKDDGRGVDIERVKQKVIEKGLISKQELETMTPSQIMNIIFWPGFSTEQEITDISGRGVGLDVVHSKISQLNGKVNVKSELGKSCTVTIQLPVTMATIKAFLIDMNEQKFAISANSISMVRRIATSEIFEKEGYKHIIYKDKTIPVFYLSDVLGFEGRVSSDKVVVIFVKEEDNEVGFIVDNLLGEQEVLHKNLEPPLMRVKNVSGIATLPSGEICLILNSSVLIKSAFNIKDTFTMPRSKPKVVDTSKFNILVVEDSLTTRVLQRNILINSGYNVETVATAQEALRKINERKYDLIISDIEMPGMSGIEFMSKLHKDIPNIKNTKKMLLSFLEGDDIKKQALNAGVDYFMTKNSFGHKEFLEIVGSLLKG